MEREHKALSFFLSNTLKYENFTKLEHLEAFLIFHNHIGLDIPLAILKMVEIIQRKQLQDGLKLMLYQQMLLSYGFLKSLC